MISLRASISLPALAILAFSLTGCQTTSGGKPVYDMIFTTPASHLSGVVAKGNLDEAAAIYKDQREYFARNTETNRSVLLSYSEGLKRQYSDLIDQNAAALNKTSWPIRREDWIELSKRLSDAQALNTRLETHDVLQRPDFRWEGLVQSRARSEKWEKILVDDVDTRFAEYPLHDAPDFFEVYPIKLSPERRERLAEQIPNRLAPLSSVDRAIAKSW